MPPKISSKYDRNIQSIKEQNMAFSYVYFDRMDKDYCVDKCKSKYFIALLDRLKDLSTWTVKRFQTKSTKSLRNHPINWEEERVSRDSFGIPWDEGIEENAWQFSISANENGRVIGFFIGNIFYIRWLDKNHNTYR